MTKLRAIKPLQEAGSTDLAAMRAPWRLALLHIGAIYAALFGVFQSVPISLYSNIRSEKLLFQAEYVHTWPRSVCWFDEIVFEKTQWINPLMGSCSLLSQQNLLDACRLSRWIHSHFRDCVAATCIVMLVSNGNWGFQPRQRLGTCSSSRY